MVCVFARETSAPLTSLVKSIDSKIAKNDGLKAFVVVLTDDEVKTTRALKKVAADAGVANVPLTLMDDPKGPASYKIDRDADVTVLMWKGAEVKVSRAYKKGELTEAAVSSIIADLPKILGD